MEIRADRQARRRRIRYRYRSQVNGTATRPRLAVFRSLKHIYVQAIDDGSATTLACASSLDPEFRGGGLRGSNVEGAKRVGEMIAERLGGKGLTQAVFDRGGNLYHGRIRGVAEGARSRGLRP
ncbi:MAG: 50S ribosomal protein L18 [Acidobacteria bacterium]|nr:50S ribosomal protein L18 [Acidobacteriota bacterium]